MTTLRQGSVVGGGVGEKGLMNVDNSVVIESGLVMGV